jgi:hypothetical protein
MTNTSNCQPFQAPELPRAGTQGCFIGDALDFRQENESAMVGVGSARAFQGWRFA